MNDRTRVHLTHGVEHPLGTLDIGVEGIQRHFEADLRKALGRQVKDIIGCGAAHRFTD